MVTIHSYLDLLGSLSQDTSGQLRTLNCREGRSRSENKKQQLWGSAPHLDDFRVISLSPLWVLWDNVLKNWHHLGTFRRSEPVIQTYCTCHPDLLHWNICWSISCPVYLLVVFHLFLCIWVYKDARDVLGHHPSRVVCLLCVWRQSHRLELFQVGQAGWPVRGYLSLHTITSLGYHAWLLKHPCLLGVELRFPSLHSKLFTDHISLVLGTILTCVCKDFCQLAFL